MCVPFGETKPEAARSYGISDVGSRKKKVCILIIASHTGEAIRRAGYGKVIADHDTSLLGLIISLPKRPLIAGAGGVSCSLSPRISNQDWKAPPTPPQPSSADSSSLLPLRHCPCLEN